MKINRKAISASVIFAGIFILSSVYVWYYQTVLYYRPFTAYSITDRINEYIAIPCTYFFIAAFVASVILDFLSIQIAEILRKILKYSTLAFIVLYTAFVIAKEIGAISVPPIGFSQVYPVVFAAFGCLPALIFHKDKA